MFSALQKSSHFLARQQEAQKVLPALRLTSKWAFVESKLAEVKEAGTWKNELMILGKQAPSIKVAGKDKEMLNFCANNYLGLSSHPLVVEAAIEAIKTHGNGYSSVRFICGTSDLHKQLESKIAAFHGREDAILYPSCFDANTGIFEALLTESDAVISDELNHASIIDGIRLCKARRLRYRHSDMGNLRQLLEESPDCAVRLIATDGVFSMDGDVAKLKEIVGLAGEFNALTFIDECHSTGFLGARGRGTEEHCGLALGSIDIVNSTLGKALGGAAGGYTCGPKSVVSLLRQRSRPYLFSNTLPPAVVGAAIRVFDLLSAGATDWPQRLRDNTRRFRGAMRQAGFQVSGDPDCPICPVMLMQERLAKDFAERMQSAGMFVVAFSYPVVPRGKARIRVQLSAGHTTEQIDRVVAEFVRVGRELKVIA